MTESVSPAGETLHLQSIAGSHGGQRRRRASPARGVATGARPQAQFGHPDLGGLGQWSAGGMVMVGRMFDDALKARVGALCAELAAPLSDEPAGGPVPSTHT